MSDARCFSCLGLMVVCGALISQPARADSTERVSVTSAEAEATGGDSYGPSISADGRFVAFVSDAEDLVSDDDDGFNDVFVRDRLTGTTARVSMDSVGNQADSPSELPSISADGRFVAFNSFATNLVTGDGNSRSDVFVHDRQTGITERVSVDSTGDEGTDHSGLASISADGRFVAFYSLAEDLVPDDDNSEIDVFVHDRQTGITERVSVDSTGGQGDNDSTIPSISADGRFVAFISDATNLVTDDLNSVADIFVHDRQTGTTERVSVTSAGGESIGGASLDPSISADGRFVAFYLHATNLVAGDGNGTSDVFVHDRQTGMTERVSVDSAGNEHPGNNSQPPSISADGRFVAFASGASALVAGDNNAEFDVFVRDRRRGATERVSLNNAGGEATGGGSFAPSISADGRFVGIPSDATNLVAGDNNAVKDVFVRDTGLLPDGNNDFLADFGGAGLWQRLNNAVWQKIHNASPALVGSGDLDGSLQDEALASFGGAGLWARYDNMTWVKLHNGTPKRFVAGDFDGNGEDDLTVDFGSAGIWVRYNNATWKKLHNGTSQEVAVDDLDGNSKDELIVDFGASGLWVRYNNTIWAKRHNASPARMLATDLDDNGKADLVADFGAAGLWVKHNNGAWVKIHPATTQDLVAGGFD